MISSVKVVIKDSSMPVSRMAEMAGRGHTPPDTASDRQWGARNEPAG